MTKALITGGAGFIGSAIARKLLAEGWQVRVLDDLFSGKLANLEGLDLEFIKGDVSDPRVVRDAVQGMDYVYHQAAVASVARSFSDPWLCHRVNVDGTFFVLDEARKAGVKRVMLAVSAAAYGTNPNLPLAETEAVAPISPYAIHKIVGELYARVMTGEMGLDVVGLRYFNVYGPRQDPQGEYAAVIPKFVSAMVAGKRPTIFGTGEQTRDFLFVEDVARANFLAATAADAPGRIINIASGSRTSLLDLVEHIRTRLGLELTPDFQPSRPGDIMHSVANVELARQVLGFTAKTRLDEGLARTVDYFLSLMNQGG